MPISLEDQIQSLLAEAPQDGETPILIERITPLLKALAEQLRHLEYFILQNAEGRWMMTTLSHREEADVEKTVIHAYAALEDALRHPQARSDGQLMAIPTPIISILFQLLALQPVTSVLFFDTPGNRKDALEIRRDDVQQWVKAQLQAYVQARSIPPDLA